MQRNARLLRGLFLLRFGLGIFLLVNALDKLVAPDVAFKAFAIFYNVPITPSVVMMVGACELVLSLLIILGFSKTVTYGLGLTVQIVATLANYPQITLPLGENNLFTGAIPILFAFIALFLLRDLDTLWTLGRKKSLFAQ